ncbi:hypothetical protein ABNX05_22110 [Lysinibacillus sp. M3]|uniref:Inner-membrane translocator n=1 Tax=Lysinibacillus zambalensis TaxID=3160866 RepID=A0ABV1MXU0_9BACI
MNGDAIVWIVLLLSIVICDYLAAYLYKNKKIPIWASAIGMALLIPVIVGSFVFLGISYNNSVELEPGDTGEGIAFAGGFMVLILAFNAIIMFVIGVILNIYTFAKNKQNT